MSRKPTFLGRIRSAKKRGIIGTGSGILRRVMNELLETFVILRYKTRRSLSGNNGIMLNLPSHTVEKNRRIWDGYDYSRLGEEWTEDAQRFRDMDPNVWKTTLISEVMFKYLKRGSTILEIGLGAGRWTEVLRTLAGRLILADISQKCLDLCKERFRTSSNIEYHLIEDRLGFLDNDSIDYIWAYDVFVHINPSDIETYVEDFARVLRPGGYAVIHHSGALWDYPSQRSARKERFRSFIGARLFADLVEKNGMKIVEQSDKYVHIPGDLISVFVKHS